jgi:hypothetical protein
MLGCWKCWWNVKIQYISSSTCWTYKHCLNCSWDVITNKPVVLWREKPSCERVYNSYVAQLTRLNELSCKIVAIGAEINLVHLIWRFATIGDRPINSCIAYWIWNDNGCCGRNQKRQQRLVRSFPSHCYHVTLIVHVKVDKISVSRRSAKDFREKFAWSAWNVFEKRYQYPK